MRTSEFALPWLELGSRHFLGAVTLSRYWLLGSTRAFSTDATSPPGHQAAASKANNETKVSDPAHVPGAGAAWSAPQIARVSASTSSPPSATPANGPDGLEGSSTATGSAPSAQGAVTNKVVTTAPWPFIDPARPQILPKRAKLAKVPVPLPTAVELVQEYAALRQELYQTKMIETVEVILHLGGDARRGDQLTRGAVVLPHSFQAGKSLRVCVFATGADADIAHEMGADIVGGEELIASILASGVKSVAFDKCIATPDMIKSVGKLGRILGPRGLMPNPKMGTVTTDVRKILAEMRQGRVEYRVDQGGNLQAGVGKVDMTASQLIDNMSALMTSVLANRPPILQGMALRDFLRAGFIKSTMTSSVAVTTESFLQSFAPKQ